MVAVGLGEVLRDLALADGVVERRVDQRRRDAEARRRVRGRSSASPPRPAFCWSDATSVSCGSWRKRSSRRGAQVLSSSRSVSVTRVLVLRARQPAADVDVLRRLHEQVDALELGQLRPQAGDDLVGGGRAALVACGLRPMKKTPVLAVVLPANMPKPATSGSCRTTSATCVMRFLHRRERGVLGGLGEAVDEAGVLLREEALGTDVEHRTSAPAVAKNTASVANCAAARTSSPRL